MGLTALAIRNAKPRTKPYKLADERSLFLLVMPNGAKYWRLSYRWSGKDKTLALGVWPEVSLADARGKRDAARKLLADGIDPAVEKKRRKLRAQFDANITFKGVAEEWLAKITREERAEVTLRKVRWLLDMVYPFLGDLPLHEIEVQEVLAVLRKIEATGRYESARRMRSVISRVFRYGIATGRAKYDVARDLRGAITVPKTKHHAAITRPKEVGVLLRAIDDCSCHAITKFALRMTPHVPQREIAEFRTAEAEIGEPEQRVAVLGQLARQPCRGRERVNQLDQRALVRGLAVKLRTEPSAELGGEEDHAATSIAGASD